MQRRHLILVLSIVMVAGLIGVGWWRWSDTREVTRSEFLMGTYIEARFYGRQAAAAMDAVFARLVEIEEKMSINLPSSEVSQIIAQAGQAAVAVSPDTFFVVERALHYAELTAGKFDPTVQPIVSLWKIGSEDARVPAPAEIADKLDLVDYRAVELDRENQTVFLTRAGMGIDLGGIAKGYAADETARILREHGVKNAYISLGGNLYTLGKNPKGRDWRIGIQEPKVEAAQGAFVAIVDTSGESLVSSGGYERYLEDDGTRYHHIIDPDTGYPAETDVLGVTIISPSSIDADGLSTSLFILGREQGLQLAEQLEDVEAIFIDKDNFIYATSGIRDKLIIANDAYTLAPAD
jgi:thiamine biosynthesis lipoprotein